MNLERQVQGGYLLYRIEDGWMAIRCRWMRCTRPAATAIPPIQTTMVRDQDITLQAQQIRTCQTVRILFIVNFGESLNKKMDSSLLNAFTQGTNNPPIFVSIPIIYSIHCLFVGVVEYRKLVMPTSQPANHTYRRYSIF